MISRDFVRLWEPQYNTRKYPVEFYLCHRASAQNAKRPEDLKNDLLALLHWKDGKAHAFVRGEAHAKPHILDPVSTLNGSALADLSRSFQNLVLASEVDFAQRKEALRNELSVMWSTVVMPAFVLHIARPDRLPIIDQHTARAFLELRDHHVVEKPKVSWNLWGEYVEFFNNAVMTVGFHSDTIQRCYVDRALFAYGKSLKKYKTGRTLPKNHTVARTDRPQSQKPAGKLYYANQRERQKLFKKRALNTPATKPGFVNLWEQISSEALEAAKEELATERGKE